MHGYRHCSIVQHSTQGRDINEINILTAASMLVLDSSCIECETMGMFRTSPTRLVYCSYCDSRNPQERDNVINSRPKECA